MKSNDKIHDKGDSLKCANKRKKGKKETAIKNDPSVRKHKDESRSQQSSGVHPPRHHLHLRLPM